MFNKMFRQVDLLERGLDTAALRQRIIAQNLANADSMIEAIEVAVQMARKKN